MDKNGHLFIVGRLKDLIVLPNGKNITPKTAKLIISSRHCRRNGILGVKDESSLTPAPRKLIAVVVPILNS